MIRRMVFYTLLVLIFVFGLWNIFGSDGLMEYFRLRAEYQRLELELEKIREEKRDLARKVLRLQEDWDYILAVLRQQSNMLPENAEIYIFEDR